MMAFDIFLIVFKEQSAVRLFMENHGSDLLVQFLSEYNFEGQLPLMIKSAEVVIKIIQNDTASN